MVKNTQSNLIASVKMLSIGVINKCKFAPPLSYFNIAPKQKQSFALMHPDFESNLITHIFRNFGVSRATGSDVIFAFVRGTQVFFCNFEHYSCLSVRIFYSLYCIFIVNANLQLE